MTTARGKAVLASSPPLTLQEMHQSEVINEIIASYLVGEGLVRQEEHFPCGAIIFTEQHKNYIHFMIPLLCWNIYREKWIAQKLFKILSKAQGIFSIVAVGTGAAPKFCTYCQGCAILSLLFFKYLASPLYRTVLLFQCMTAKRLPLALAVCVNGLFLIIQIIWT